MQTDSPPVIAIDGPSASGKGTVASAVAQRLGMHYLDSGALYRALGVVASHNGIDMNDVDALASEARALPLRFDGGNIDWLGQNIAPEVRTETAGEVASKLGAMPLVRAALLDLQRDFRQSPGLVTDGRDMGSVVFPDAKLKVFLTASVEVRAERRHKQLLAAGIHARFDDLLSALAQRDERDRARSVAPLVASVDAKVLDTSEMTVEVAIETVCRWYLNA